MLRTLAVTAGLGARSGPTWVYGLDFGAQGLAMLEGLPHVGAIVRGSDDERVRRTLSWLQGVTEERAARYVSVNAGTVSEYRRASGRTDEPRILLLVDNLAGFLKAYETNDVWIDRLVSIAAQGRPVGVHLVVTADRSGAVPTQLAATIQQRLVMRMTGVDDYDNLGAPRFVLSPTSVAGRGIWEGQEVQVAVLGRAAEPGKAPDLGVQDREMRSVARVMREAGVPAAVRIERLSDHIELSSLPVASGHNLVVGTIDETREPLSIRAEGTFVVAGPPSAGRTTALATIVAAFHLRYPHGAAHLFTLDRRSRLLSLPGWTDRALGTDEGTALADRVATACASELRQPMLIVVEKVAEWGDGLAEFSMDSMIKAATAAGALVVVDGEASTFGRTFGLAGTANTSKAGFLLQPDNGDGSAFGAKLPMRLNRSDFPPGRGFAVRSGRVALSQWAIVAT